MNSTVTFESTQTNFKKILDILEDKSKQSTKAAVKIIDLTLFLWNKSSTVITEFHEKGNLLIIVVKVLVDVSLMVDNLSNQNIDVDEASSKCNEFIELVLSQYSPDTLKTISVETLFDQDSLLVLEDLIFHYTKICSLPIPNKYLLKTCVMIVDTSVKYKSQLSSCKNEWMDVFVSYICERLEFFITQSLTKFENQAPSNVLRFYNQKLIELSKAYPNELFRGAKIVLQLLFSLQKLLHSVEDKYFLFIHMNGLVPLLSFLQEVQIHDEILPTISQFTQENPSVSVKILIEFTKIIAKNQSNEMLHQYFGDHLNENLFEILFEAILQSNNQKLFEDEQELSSILSGLVVCITAASQNEKSYQSVISRLITALLSDNITNAYLSLNLWIFIARISSKEVCYTYFNEFKAIYVQKFAKFDTSKQKFFIGKVMQVFFMCLKSKLKKQVIFECELEENLEMWAEIGINIIEDENFIGKVLTKAEDKIQLFFRTKSLASYHDIIQYLKITSSLESIRNKTFLESIDEICVFLKESSSNIEPFLPLLGTILKFCTKHIQEINTRSLELLISLLKHIESEKSFTKSLQYITMEFVNKVLTKRVELEIMFLNSCKVLYKAVTNDLNCESHSVEMVMIKTGFDGKIEDDIHVCRRPENMREEEIEVKSPVMKKRKIEITGKQGDAKVDRALTCLENLKRELNDSGLLTSLPTLVTNLNEIKDVLQDFVKK
uniref:CSON012297 protein n=1 Tax=Culicoides sonorensis TaxID=179676 RepID=A0A336LZM1_CULSO